MSGAKTNRMEYGVLESPNTGLELAVENMHLSMIRNGLLITSLGFVLFYSAHDQFHRLCSAMLMIWGMCVMSVVTTLSAIDYASLLNRRTWYWSTLIGWVTMLLIATFLVVEIHRGSLWILEREGG